MTRGPRRLKDDPDFQWETGCDVGAEEGLVGDYDLPGLRERILAAAATSPPPVTVGDGMPGVREGAGRGAWRGSVVKPVVGVIAAVAIIGGAYWLGVRAGTERHPAAPTAEQTDPRGASAPSAPPGIDPRAPLAPPEATGGAALAPPDPMAPPGPRVGGAPLAGEADPEPASAGSVASASTLALPVDAGEPGAVGAADVAVDPVEDPVAAVVPTDDAASGSSASPDAIASAPRGSDLAAQQAAYEGAKSALDDGRFAEARRGFEASIARWPTGALSAESQLGLLQALYGLGDAGATLRQAEKIDALPAFSGRHEEIALLRAQALVRLDRCDEALLVLEGSSERGAADIRRACRQPPQRRKETAP